MEPGFHPGRSIREKLRRKNAGLVEQRLWDSWKNAVLGHGYMVRGEKQCCAYER